MPILNTFFNTLLFSKNYWIIRHLLFWMIMYTDELLALSVWISRPFDLKFFIIQISADLILVYINLYILIPRYLSRKRLVTYIAGTLATICMALISNYFIIISYAPDIQDIIVVLFRSFLLTMGVLGTAIAIKIIKKTLTNQQRVRALEKLSYETEVNYLKMQVNPHFLFNTLNNIYVQSKKYPAVVSDSIMKLSDLMRYQIYNGSKNTVFLKDELKFINDYLDLEKIRKDNMIINTSWKVTNQNLEVSPLLFIPLVENAIKHSYCKNGGVCTIEVYCATHEGEIIFDISNNIGDGGNNHAGIGLKNLKRRLEILYPDKHIISINQVNNRYSVSLRINTND